MYRILHFSDVHLDTSFAVDLVTGSVGSRRRADLRATLGCILALARERRVDAVTIGGDLYEQEYVLPETADFLAQQFSRLAPARVFIAPGEHDSYTNDSLYALTSWPENVRIFSQGPLCAEPLAPGLTLWAAACPPPRGDRSLKGFQLQGDGTHLLLLHAAEVGQRQPEQGTYLVDPPAVRDAGFAFALLGHHHEARLWPVNAPNLAYPGSPEPLSSREAQSAHEVLLLAVDGGACKVERIPISHWRYVSLQVDLTSSPSVSDAPLRVRRAVEAAVGEDAEHVHCNVTLTGRPDCDLSVTELAGQIESRVPIQYEAQFSFPYDLDRLGQEETVRGLLVRRLQERLRAARSAEDHHLAQAALLVALRALDGRQVNIDEVC